MEHDTEDALLRDGAWLHRLAHHLVRDPELAEDAAQETLVAALERPPARGAGRGWLRAVLRNALRQSWRREHRRREREDRARVRDTSPGADETATRLAVQRAVVGAVEALDEPLRTTVVLRYLDGHPPREVARRMDVPVKTVHSRLERALPRLRARLDREVDGGRDAWTSSLLLLLQPTGARPWPAIEAPSAATALKAVAVVALLAAGGMLSLWRLGPSPEPAGPVADPNVPRAGRAGLSAPTPGRSDRRVVTPPRELDVPPRADHVTTGRVVDVEGRGVAGVRILTVYGEEPDADGAPVRSGEDGRFRLRTPTTHTILEARDEDWITLQRVRVDHLPRPGPPTVVVVPRRRYAGHVVDERGAPLAGARLRVVLPPSGLLRQTRRQPLSGTTFSAADGGFALDRAGWAERARLEADLAGREPRTLELPPVDQGDLELVLAPRPEAVVARGRVVDPEGAPVAGAHVALAPILTCDNGFLMEPPGTRTTASGSFALELEHRAEGEVEVRAIAPGWQLAGRTVPLEADRGEVTLALDRPAATLRGRVLDPEGVPVAGAAVWTWDRTPFGLVESGGAELISTRLTACEELARDEGGRPRARSDEHGRYELSGLMDRAYTVYARSPETHEIVTVTGARPGEEPLDLRLEGNRTTSPVAGRVTRPDGSPVEEVRIHLSRRVTLPDGTTREILASDTTTSTDGEGRFAFPEVCTEGTVLHFGRVPLPERVELADVPDPTAVDLVLPAVCWLRVTVDAPSADQVSVLDADGVRLDLAVEHGRTIAKGVVARLVGGRSEVLWTDERAATLVLLKEGKEVARHPLDLEPGELLELRR